MLSTCVFCLTEVISLSRHWRNPHLPIAIHSALFGSSPMLWCLARGLFELEYGPVVVLCLRLLIGFAICFVNTGPPLDTYQHFCCRRFMCIAKSRWSIFWEAM